MKTWLVERALRWESDHPEALYQFGVAQAERGKHEDARSLFRRAVAADPGKSEAWLDLARTWALDDRPGDARAALQAARRADPTRFDVALRLAHLRLGPEPVPGDPTPSRSWVPILRAYNEAADLAPDRFENLVAQARLLRRREGTAEAMARADDLLTAAARATQQRRVPTSMRGTPLGLFFGAATEVQVEAFRLAEALDKPEAVTVGLLEMALSRSAETAASMRREAERFLDTGRQREGEARKEAATTLDPRAFAATDRAYDAATLRLAALLRAARLDVTATHKAARDDKRGKRHRAALARYRALLAWSASETAQITEGGDIRPLRANLLIETAQSATRVGGGHARQYYARAFVLRAAVALDQQDEADALRKAGRALEYDDTSADAWMVRGRALARQGDTKGAADAIARALEFGPHLKGRVQRDEDLADVRQRPDIQTLLR